MTTCILCHHARFETVYSGPIRVGKFDSLSERSFDHVRCLNCQAIRRTDIPEDLQKYYAEGDYRATVNDTTGVEAYYQWHDDEQAQRQALFGLSGFRGKVVADIGCGGGSFLDSIAGVARRLVAVELDKIFQASLASRGYTVFPSTTDAVAALRKEVDVAVSFDVLEHIPDPLHFLKEIHALLRPGSGRLFLCTPNADDVLLSALPEEYSRFSYRVAHLWYFNAKSLVHLLEQAGFVDVKLMPHQRFGLGNFLGWLRDRTPQGALRPEYVTEAMDAVWRAELERTLRCDILYAEAIPA